MQENGRKEKQSSKQPKKVSHHLVKSSVPLVNNLAKHSRSMLNDSSLNFLYIPSEDKVEFPMDSTSDENVNTRMFPNPIKYTVNRTLHPTITIIFQSLHKNPPTILQSLTQTWKIKTKSKTFLKLVLTQMKNHQVAKVAR